MTTEQGILENLALTFPLIVGGCKISRGDASFPKEIWCGVTGGATEIICDTGSTHRY